VPFDLGDRVVRGKLRGTVVAILRQDPNGERQILRVRWGDGTEAEVSGRDLRVSIEKRGLGRDDGRCTECGAAAGNHLSTCSRR
jgi:hypothetical protein